MIHRLLLEKYLIVLVGMMFSTKINKVCLHSHSTYEMLTSLPKYALNFGLKAPHKEFLQLSVTTSWQFL